MCKSNYRRQYNNQKENDKMTNNELQNTAKHKKNQKIEKHESH